MSNSEAPTPRRESPSDALARIARQAAEDTSDKPVSWNPGSERTTDTAVAPAPAPAPEATRPAAPALDTEELTRGYLRHSDYTRGKQSLAQEKAALAAERAALEAQKERLAQLDELEETVRGNPELAQAWGQAYQQYGRPPQAPRANGVDPAVKAQLESLQQEQRALKEELFVGALRDQSGRLAARHNLSAADADRVVKHAIDDGLIDFSLPAELIGKRLRTAYNDLHAEEAETRGQKDLLERVREKDKAASPSGQSTAAPPPEKPVDTRGMNERQLASFLQRRVEKQFGI